MMDIEYYRRIVDQAFFTVMYVIIIYLMANSSNEKVKITVYLVLVYLTEPLNVCLDVLHKGNWCSSDAVQNQFCVSI